jgi:hypothetical protein
MHDMSVRSVLISNLVSLLVFGVIRQVWPSYLLYEQLLFLAFATGLFAGIGKLTSKFTILAFFKKYNFGNFLVALLLSYSVTTSSIMTIDRSRSVYVLSWIDELHYVERIEFFVESKFGGVEKSALSQRIDEQIQRNLVESDGNSRLTLTWLGKLFLKTARLTAVIFNLEYFHKYT